MELVLEVEHSVAIKRKKPWPKLCWLGEVSIWKLIWQCIIAIFMCTRSSMGYSYWTLLVSVRCLYHQARQKGHFPLSIQCFRQLYHSHPLVMVGTNMSCELLTDSLLCFLLLSLSLLSQGSYLAGMTEDGRLFKWQAQHERLTTFQLPSSLQDNKLHLKGNPYMIWVYNVDSCISTLRLPAVHFWWRLTSVARHSTDQILSVGGSCQRSSKLFAMVADHITTTTTTSRLSAFLCWTEKDSDGCLLLHSPSELAVCVCVLLCGLK